MAKTKECVCTTFKMENGDLVCSQCGEPSPSKTWPANVHGTQNFERIRGKKKPKEEI